MSGRDRIMIYRKILLLRVKIHEEEESIFFYRVQPVLWPVINPFMKNSNWNIGKSNYTFSLCGSWAFPAVIIQVSASFGGAEMSARHLFPLCWPICFFMNSVRVCNQWFMTHVNLGSKGRHQEGPLHTAHFSSWWQRGDPVTWSQGSLAGNSSLLRFSRPLYLEI